MLDRMLARIGVGAATVDTYLSSVAAVPGGTLSGDIVIQGGQVPQEINRLYLQLMTRYKVDDRTHNHVLSSYTIGEPLTVQPQTQVAQPFAIELPTTTPLTVGRTPIYLVTGLDLTGAFDPKDSDTIQVTPHPLQQRVLTALDELGFQLWHAETEYDTRWGRLVQELEFRPSGRYREHLRELELIFGLDHDGLDVFIEIDRRARGLGLFFESLNEQRGSLHFTLADMERSDWTARLQATIDARL